MKSTYLFPSCRCDLCLFVKIEIGEDFEEFREKKEEEYKECLESGESELAENAKRVLESLPRLAAVALRDLSLFGIYHRDFKPSNLIVLPSRDSDKSTGTEEETECRVCCIDFGSCLTANVVGLSSTSSFTSASCVTPEQSLVSDNLLLLQGGDMLPLGNIILRSIIKKDVGQLVKDRLAKAKFNMPSFVEKMFAFWKGREWDTMSELNWSDQTKEERRPFAENMAVYLALLAGSEEDIVNSESAETGSLYSKLEPWLLTESISEYAKKGSCRLVDIRREYEQASPIFSQDAAAKFQLLQHIYHREPSFRPTPWELLEFEVLEVLKVNSNKKCRSKRMK